MTTFLSGAIWEWEGDVMRPLPHFRKRCDDKLVVGQHYRLDTRDAPSLASRGHYFAAIEEAWAQLPEKLASEFPSAEALRKKALIHCGYRDEIESVWPTSEAARQYMALIEPRDQFAIVVVDGCVVTEMTAQSQSEANMGRARFQESKTRTLDWISALIGVDVATLKANTARAA